MSGVYVAQVSNTARGTGPYYMADNRESVKTTGDRRAVDAHRRTLRFLFRSRSNFSFLPLPNGRLIVIYRRLFVLVLVLFVTATMRRAQPVSAGDEWQP